VPTGEGRDQRTHRYTRKPDFDALRPPPELCGKGLYNFHQIEFRDSEKRLKEETKRSVKTKETMD
jgi:hypothetical protein